MDSLLGFAADVGLRIRNVIKPLLGAEGQKSIEGIGASGDSTFRIDEIAEEVLEESIAKNPKYAYYSEDRGFVGKESAEAILIVDPIDGTRPAAAGLESCCVSVGAAPMNDKDPFDLKMSDLYAGFIAELKNDACFSATADGYIEIYINGMKCKSKHKKAPGLERLFWTTGFRGRPILPTAIVLRDLVDISSVDGGVFEIGSATFGITRLITGQMDAYVDIGDRIVRDIPETIDIFKRVGHGHIVNNSSYDLAAALIIARAAGICISDAYGRDIEAYPLFTAKNDSRLSCVTAADEEAHRNILHMIDSGMDRLRSYIDVNGTSFLTSTEAGV